MKYLLIIIILLLIPKGEAMETGHFLRIKSNSTITTALTETLVKGKYTAPCWGISQLSKEGLIKGIADFVFTTSPENIFYKNDNIPTFITLNGKVIWSSLDTQKTLGDVSEIAYPSDKTPALEIRSPKQSDIRKAAPAYIWINKDGTTGIGTLKDIPEECKPNGQPLISGQ